MISIKREFPWIDMTLVGAAESAPLAVDLALACISVILHPVDCLPTTWESRRCTDDTVKILTDNGVRVAVGTSDPDLSRQLRWEAGKARARGLTEADALALITSRPAAVMGLKPWQAGYLGVLRFARLVAFNGDPMSSASQPQIVIEGKTVVVLPSQHIVGSAPIVPPGAEMEPDEEEQLHVGETHEDF